jgi:Concanavalin A-like lectin/glucanases superfamily
MTVDALYGADGQVRPAGYARLGGNTVWGEWFAGTIDELNVYNRALTAAEIAVDMNAT